jgi:hypothetical protein
LEQEEEDDNGQEGDEEGYEGYDENEEDEDDNGNDGGIPTKFLSELPTLHCITNTSPLEMYGALSF